MIESATTTTAERSAPLFGAPALLSTAGPRPAVQSVVPAPRIWATGLLLAASMTTSCFMGAPAARAVPLGDHTTRPMGKAVDSDIEAPHDRAELPVDGLSREAQEASELQSATLVKKIHDESGLTWDQLSKALGVSRRSVHLWASGGRINGRHMELLSELARMVRNAPVTTPAAVRSWLLVSKSGQPSPLEAFKAQHKRGETTVSGVGYTASQLLGVDAD